MLPLLASEPTASTGKAAKRQKILKLKQEVKHATQEFELAYREYKQVLERAVLLSPQALDNIHHDDIFLQMALLAAEKHEDALLYVHIDEPDYLEIALRSVESFPKALRFVPSDLKGFDTVLAAVIS